LEINRLVILLFLLSIQLVNCGKISSPGEMQMAASILIMNSYSQPLTQSKSIIEDTADTVTDAPNHTGVGFRDSRLAVNGVRGAGSSSGSGDVFSLASTGTSASITLEWKNKRVLNGSGIDFVVFENPFNYSGENASRYMEAIIVEVSQDNINYCGFSPDYTFSNESTYSKNPQYWQRFAGITPVLYNMDTNPLYGEDLYTPQKAGGDAFDLDNLSSSNDYGIGCSTILRDKIKSEGFIYIRLTSATARVNPDTAQNYLQDSGAFSGGADIDGVIAKYRASR